MFDLIGIEIEIKKIKILKKKHKVYPSFTSPAVVTQSQMHRRR